MENRKKPKGIFFEATEAQKRVIKRNADLCGMRQGEYILRRALGYEPKAVQPEAFYRFHNALCELLSRPLTAKTEAAALRLFDTIYAELFDDRKQSAPELQKEMRSWQPPDCGP